MEVKNLEAKTFLNLINYPNFILNFAISGGLRENVF